MFLRHSLRALPRASLPLATTARRTFLTTRPALINVGDTIPTIELMENTPGTKVNLADEISKKGDALIIGVPAAFSGSCSSTHVPSYINHPKTKDFPVVAVVSVNDVFVMKAWGDNLDPAQETGIRFLADPTGAFTKAMDMSFGDAAPIFGGERSKRYAVVVKDGKVASVSVEPDNTGTTVSMADKVLGSASVAGADKIV
ncbi:AhpC/TSA family protein [Coniochaeta hoffmannii]|uniref:AhpC/TSA family protein n=1 Tax=Coniochaeta hoffmannii TaxID=91930 RepID=A0AA38RNX1_9PEZI|nr:AhpC/TSA family protein [Coniochaeta hoffmannii]